MKYAVQYNSSFRYLNEVDEVVFQYSGTDQIIDFIPSVLQEEQTAVINLTEIAEENIKEVIVYLNKLKEIHSNFKVQIDFYNQKDFIGLLNDNDIQFMFWNMAGDRDILTAMLNYNITDIYIVEDLAFNLKDISEYLKGKVSIRVFPDIAQYKRGAGDEISDLTKFFIRPEDVELYEEYVDVLEIFRLDIRQSTVYEVYKQEQWLGALDFLIMDFKAGISNTHIEPHFGKTRLNCGKRCAFGKCNVCKNIEQLSKSLEDAGLEIVKPRKRSEVPVEEE